MQREMKSRLMLLLKVYTPNKGGERQNEKNRLLIFFLHIDTTIFHAGTTIKNGILQTSGGRVLAANSTATTLEEAVKQAYEGIAAISFEDMFFRKDIAHRAFRQAPKKEALTYAQAGVSIDAGNALVERIKSVVKSTKRPGANAEVGGFGGTFELAAAGYHPESPILIGTIDGVGTKLKIAHAMNKHDTIGIDLVAMSVNDLVVQGAEALFFLDCYSTSHLDVETAALFVGGVAKGCTEAGCVLLGGETAEMPGMYQDGEYDAVGTATGAIHHSSCLLPKTADMVAGDVLLGLKSNGFHSNGFSLIRNIVEKAGLEYTSPAPWEPTKSIGESLLTPTRIYVKSCYAAAQQGLVKGMAHITGGGLTENIPRMLPIGLAAQVDVSAWPLSEAFSWFKRSGAISTEEFVRVWNVGIGMVLVVSRDKAAQATKVLEGNGETVYQIGGLVPRGPSSGDACIFLGFDSWRD